MFVFQYMIGNVDYNIGMMCNVKMVCFYIGIGVILVFYDFDFVGFVDLFYVILNLDYGFIFVK